MAIALSGAIAGGAQTGFTAPAHTSTTDQPPTDKIAKKFIVTTATGQPSARIHSGADPFSITFSRPSRIQNAPVVSLNGVIVGTVPLNVYEVWVHKGMYVAGTNVRTGFIHARFGIPAGADLVDPANVRAMHSYFIGSLSNQSSGWGDSTIQGYL